MNRLKTLILALFVLAPDQLQSQKIDMEFPHFAGKTYEFIIFQGYKNEKIIQGTIPPDGKFSLSIPQEYAPYHGMSRWLITNTQEGGGIDMVISGKDFSVSCLDARPNEANIIYRGNTEVKELNDLYKQQQAVVMKYNAMYQSVKSFSQSDKNYPVFEQEFKAQETAFLKFQNDLKVKSDYVKKLLPIINITQGIGAPLDNEQKRGHNILDYVSGEMDWEVLYTSGHWGTVINEWINIHTQIFQDHYAFTNDLIKVANRIQNKKIYRDFAEKIAYELTRLGKDSIINSIAPYINASGKIDNYDGNLAAYKIGALGTSAPDLIFTEHVGSINDHNHSITTLKSNELAGKDFNQTLLVFYESGCGPCENLLQQLPGNYKDLLAKKVRVISISADREEDIFKSKSKSFPWKEVYCDYDGKQGINFKNYGIAGTPTLILIDKAGKIILKTAALGELLDKLK